MPFDKRKPVKNCPICQSYCNINGDYSFADPIIDCVRCGDFIAKFELIQDWPQHGAHDEEKCALASHLIRKLEGTRERPTITLEMLEAFLKDRKFATVTEASDNLIRLMGDTLAGMPGRIAHFEWVEVAAIIGVRDGDDVFFIGNQLEFGGEIEYQQKPVREQWTHPGYQWSAYLTLSGWKRYYDLMRSQTSSNFAFFARQFNNPDLDVVTECLKKAVAETGFELRTVSQKAGLIDAIIEDEIRRCKFLLADLSDDNAGAYWEAGFAEGLGKPVIYVCKAIHDGERKKTHFDADHRHTVRWDVQSLDDTERQLKAVIRNTLLGDCIQTDK